MRSPSVLTLALVFAGLLVVLPGQAQAQSPTCLDAAKASARKLTPDLPVVLERLDAGERESVQKWLDCDKTHYDLPRVYELALRQLDDEAKGSRRLFLTASQSIEVPEVEGAFPRSELVPRLKGVTEARALLDRSLEPPSGALGWEAVLADLNAETQSLEGWTRVLGAGSLDGSKVRPRDELAVSLLMLATYLEHARAEHSAFYVALRDKPAAVDAIGNLVGRALRALAAAPASLGKEDHALLTLFFDKYQEKLEKLFEQAGRPTPAFDKKAALNAEAQANASPDAGSDPDKVDPDQATNADAGSEPAKVDPDKVDNADAGGADAHPAEADAGAAKPTVVLADAGPSGSDAGVDKDASVGSTSGDVGSDASADAGATSLAGASDDGPLSVWGKIRLGLLGFGALLPWLLVGMIVLIKRKKPEDWAPAANRVLALSTFLLIIEVLFVGLILVTEGASLLLSWDALLAIVPPYNFAVLLLMLGRLDTGAQLASRAMIRSWAKWGSISLAALLALNIVFAVFSGLFVLVGIPISQILIPLTLLIIGIAASIFMVRLWRTGNTTGASAASDAEGEAKVGEGGGKDPDPPKNAPKAPSPKSDAKAPKAKDPEPPPMSAEELAALEAELSAPRPERKAAPAQSGPKAKKAGDVTAMSDEELGALFEAMGDGETKDDDIPDDRKDLYALLGDD